MFYMFSEELLLCKSLSNRIYRLYESTKYHKNNVKYHKNNVKNVDAINVD